jgi:hypothetical protein
MATHVISAQYLPRVFDFLKAATDVNFVPQSDFKGLQMAVDAVKEDLEQAKKVLSGTMDLMSLYKRSSRFTTLFPSRKQVVLLGEAITWNI